MPLLLTPTPTPTERTNLYSKDNTKDSLLLGIYICVLWRQYVEGGPVTEAQTIGFLRSRLRFPFCSARACVSWDPAGGVGEE